MLRRNIVIIGITGVGKTTIGKALADKLGKAFIDLDKNIELRCGVDIPTIFEIEGEAGFRDRETDELRRITNTHANYVLSIGGGCVVRAENRALLGSGSNLIVQLYADTATLVDRLSKSPSKRPLFANVDIEKKVMDLYQARKEYYDKVTDIKINTSSLKPSQVVEQIIARL
jgi:shikimate kinase